MSAVPLRVLGVPIRQRPVAQPLEPGKDFPHGIEFLDVQWFVERIGLDTIKGLTDEELPMLRYRATFIMELLSLKELATRKK